MKSVRKSCLKYNAAFVYVNNTSCSATQPVHSRMNGLVVLKDVNSVQNAVHPGNQKFIINTSIVPLLSNGTSM